MSFKYFRLIFLHKSVTTMNINNNKIFITGIGTGIGKTLASAVVTQALQANYCKPIQAGIENPTDSQFVENLISNNHSKVVPELYKLQLPASPHIAAKNENIEIDIKKIIEYINQISNFQQALVIEGAGGILVPINSTHFMIDVIKQLNASVILVSKNYLGSINHSLLTAAICQQHNINVLGWIFNDNYLNYENEIVAWSGYKKLLSIPYCNNIDKNFIATQANNFLKNL